MAEYHWSNARHSVVRELGWSVFGEPISHFQQDERTVPWRPRWDEEARFILKTLDDNPAPLVDYLESLRDRRLGARFEALWHYFLFRHSFYEVLAANLQISHGEYTLGALDFLLRDGHSGLVVHLELAVKFYLYYPSATGDDLSRWIGPNPDDNLGLKIHHMAEKQLPLSTREEVVGFLKSHDYPVPNVRTGLMMGYLFSPLDETLRPATLVNPQCPRGHWLYEDQLEALSENHSKCAWAVLEKENWLDPIPAVSGTAGTVLEVARELLRNTARPVLLGKTGPEGRVERFFVVPEAWPARDYVTV
jgi:uncharacterized protein